MLVLVDVIAVADDAPSPDFRRKPSIGDAVHEALGLEAMRDELRDGDECEAVLLREALELSSLRFSQTTPAGVRPARRARSTAASVWPTRWSTPPSRARSGGTCPGRRRSPGTVLGSTATRMVLARSWALTPVVIPKRSSASMLMVKAVRYSSVLTSLC